MDGTRRPGETDAFERLSERVRQEVQAGTDTDTLIVRLQAEGLKADTARQLVESVRRSTGGALDTETRAGSFLPAVIGGLAAAVIGGVVWGLITVATEYEIGWVAWGIGLLAGYGVVLFAGGRRGRSLQLVAVAAALLGIVIGKYLTFFHALKGYVGEEYGAEAVAELSMFSVGMIQFFVASAGEFLSGFDALWILLAVGTAWGIPKLQQAEIHADTG